MNKTYISPSGRKISVHSPAYKLLKRIEKIDEPIIAIDIPDRSSANIVKMFTKNFEGSWISNLAIANKLGFTHRYNVSIRDYLNLIHDIKETSLDNFIIVNIDNSGLTYNDTETSFQLLSVIGVSLGFIDNKKRSRFTTIYQDTNGHSKLESRQFFAQKINKALKIQNKLLVGIRLEESIIYKNSNKKILKECVQSAIYFIQFSKPDFFLFTAKKGTPSLPLDFAKSYYSKMNALGITQLPYLACIFNTSSPSIPIETLYKAGYKLIIYENFLLKNQLKSIISTILNIKKRYVFNNKYPTLSSASFLINNIK